MDLWLGELVDLLANIMPDVNPNELPACLTIVRVDEMYNEAILK